MNQRASEISVLIVTMTLFNAGHVVQLVLRSRARSTAKIGAPR